jgi:minor extracellular serine protease Vpr
MLFVVFRRIGLKKVICLVLFISILFAFLPVYANQSLPNKINFAFLSEVENSKNLIPVMVELRNDPVVVYARNSFDSRNYFQLSSFEYGTNDEDSYRSNIMIQQDHFLLKLHNQGISFNYRYSCTDVLNSVALEVKGTEIEKLLNISEIFQIHDDRLSFYAERAIAVETSGAKNAWQGVGSLGSITGKGVVVGILDTGLDKVHMTEGEFVGRVKGGFDIADGDADFNDDTVGHGTHVAGIIGGKGKMEFQRGMAYEVSYRIYKVFPSRGGSARNIGEAIDRSVREKCQVINMSLGMEGDTKTPAKDNPYYGTIIKNATIAGTIVVASAGNSGSRGKNQPFPAGSPGITEDAFCVAATDDRPNSSVTISTEKTSRYIRLAFGQGTPSFDPSFNELPIVPCGYGNPEDFVEDVSGKIALIQRGPAGNNKMTYRYKMDNAIAQGAKAVLLYDHTAEGLLAPTILFTTADDNITIIPTAMMVLGDGLWLKSNLQGTYHLNFSSINKNSVASFSSMGPTPDGFFKPEITAPGTYILSTFPKGQYVPMSGTSMSSPAVTGLVALLRQAHPVWDVDHIKSALMNTAEILLNPVNNLPVTFLIQGAGEARIDRALVTPALLNPRALIVQKDKIEPGRIKSDQAVKFTLESNSSSDQTFALTYKIFGFPEDGEYVKLTFEKNELAVPSYKTVDFTVSFEIDWKKLTKNSYEGIIQVGDSLHIPFVVFKDSVLKLPDAISSISIGNKELTFTKESQEQDIKISYSLNSGSEFKAGGEIDYSNYASIELFITDDQGEIWGTIANLSNYVVGNYEYHWNGKATDGKYFLPKGKYFVQFRIMGHDYDKKGEYVFFATTRDESSQFNIAGSSIPDPTIVLLSCNKVVQMNDHFSVNLLLPEVTNCLGIEIEITYDAKKLIGEELLNGGFLSSDGVSVTIDQNIDDDKGIITARILRDENIGISGSHGKILEIIFKAIDTGKLKFALKTSKVIFADDSSVRMKAIFPNIRISEEDDFLLSDLNDDKIIDRYDWVIFMESYSSKIDDVDYNSNCDFNQDQLINFEDLLILSKEYGKEL